jgi:hypothetical protein
VRVSTGELDAAACADVRLLLALVDVCVHGYGHTQACRDARARTVAMLALPATGVAAGVKGKATAVGVLPPLAARTTPGGSCVQQHTTHQHAHVHRALLTPGGGFGTPATHSMRSHTHTHAYASTPTARTVGDSARARHRRRHRVSVSLGVRVGAIAVRRRRRAVFVPRAVSATASVTPYTRTRIITPAPINAAATLECAVCHTRHVYHTHNHTLSVRAQHHNVLFDLG